MALTRYYLGIDGGQSSTTALIADEGGRVLGLGRGGPCNHVAASEGREKFRRAVGACLDEACRQARLDPATVEFAFACLGFSGGAADKADYARELVRSRRYKITHDAEIALTGATNGDPGILVIGGTGSIAFGRNAAGRTARAGGWGYIFGDEGGGFDLTRRALRAALRDEEGWGPATQLRSMLLAATGAPDMNDLLHRFYTPAFPRPQIASFSRLVSSAAAVGDEIARQILRDAASALALYAGGVYHQLFSADEEFQVAYVGGVFTSDLLRNEFDRLIQEQMEAIPGPPQFGPAAGALLEALRGDGNESHLSHVPEFEK